MAIANDDVEDNAMLVDGTPEIVLNSPDSDKHFVHVPLVSRPWPTTAQATGECLAEFIAPSPHCLIGNDNASLGQQQPDVTRATTEHVIRPHGMANDCGREPVAVAAGRVVASCTQFCPHLHDRQMVTVTMLAGDMCPAMRCCAQHSRAGSNAV
jgi:hypothetical protein